MKYLSMILLMIFAVSIQAQTTEFTFQGKLNESGAPVSSPRDLRFRLWNAESAGTQVGVDVTVANATFVAGVFSVRIDFGEAEFNGEPRWIEIAISQPGAGAYTTLQPRQALGSSPYAIKSLNSVQAESAQLADTAQNSNSLGGISATQYVLTADARLSDARDPLPGSASYIQNQNAAPQTSTNFSISGTGSANILRAETQFNLGTSRVFHSPGSNLFVGKSTGTNFTTGFFNTVVGGTAGNGMINASANSLFGSGAGFDNQGSENSFFGMNAGQQNQSGAANSFFGKEAGAANLNGARNSFFGIGTGASNTIGNDLTLLGSTANVGADGLNFATAIGSGSVVNTSDTIVIGKTAGSYNGVNRPADTVHTPGILSSGAQFNLSGSRILSSGFNTLSVGHSTGNNGQFNTFVGTFAGNKTTGNNNVFVGNIAGFENLSGGSNVFVGSEAGRKTTTGQINSMFGTSAGIENTTGSSNAFFGRNAGSRNTGGNSNTFVGSDANFSSANATGSGNTLLGWLTSVAPGVNDATAIGTGAQVTQDNTIVLGRSFDTVQVPGSLTTAGTLGANILNATQFTIGGNPALSYGAPGFNLHVGNNSPSSTGTGNSFVGHFAGFANTTGTFNTYFGLDAGRLGTTGGGNSFFGKNAGSRAFVGNDNTFIGQHADFANVANPTGNGNSLVGSFTTVNSGINNSSAIGFRALATQSNSIILGGINGVNGATSDTSVGVGTTAPKARLEVAKGDLLIGSPGQGIILKSGTGNTCVRLTIDDTPTFIGTVVPCP